MPVPTGAKVPRPLAWGYEASISDGVTDLLLRMATAPGREFSITTAPLAAQQINTAQVPEEFRAEFGQSYGRSDFSGGQGLDQAHQRNTGPNDFRRFFDSKGVNVFRYAGEKGEQYKIELLHQTTLARSDAATNQVLVSGNNIIYVGDGNKVQQSTDNGANFTELTPDSSNASRTVQDMIIYGGDLYVAMSDGTDGTIRKYDVSTTTWSDYNTVSKNYTRVFTAKDFIFGVDGTTGNLLNVSSGSGAPAIVKDLPDNTSWVGLTDAGAVILAAASNGYVYSIKDDSGLTIKGQTFFEGEELTDIIESNGIIFVGAKQKNQQTNGFIGRLYMAELAVSDNLYVITGKQVMKEWGDENTTVDRGPMKFMKTREQIFMGVIEDANETHLWSVYLPTLGMARDLYYSSASKEVQGLCVANDILFFSLKDIGVVKEDVGNYVTEGYIILPAADFYTASAKQWIGARVYTNQMSGGAEVQTLFSKELEDLSNPSSSNYTTIENVQIDGTGEEVPLVNVISRWLVPKIVIRSGGSQTFSPYVYSYSLRAFPEPEDVIVKIPVNVSDRIERPGKSPKNIPGIGKKIFDQIQRLEGKSVTLDVFKPEETVRGIVENVTLPVSEISKQGSTMIFCFLTIRGQIEVTDTSQVTSLGALGVGTLGVYQFGT
jgi:hypothetical protein|tara:strand:+ start:1295 stop:3271 length:1977 start_codon:yes stop_codon:yes gene_type:complete